LTKYFQNLLEIQYLTMGKSKSIGIKVTLRKRSIGKDKESLYLDYYPPIVRDGQETRRFGLGIYLTHFCKAPDKLSESKLNKLSAFEQMDYNARIMAYEVEAEQNMKKWAKAELIRNIHDNQVNNPNNFDEKLTEINKRHDLLLTKQEQEQARIEALQAIEEKRLNIDFLKFFQSLAYKREGSNADNWISAYQYLRDFVKMKFPVEKEKDLKLLVKDITVTLCNEFKDYLLTAPSRKNTLNENRLSQNSALSYFSKFKASLKEGFTNHDAKLFVEPIYLQLETIKREEVTIEFLDMAELNRLANTPCEDDLLRRVSLFSAITGLRFSDIQNLTWQNVRQSEKGVLGSEYSLYYTQQKTGEKVQNHPITAQAYELMGQRQDDQVTVFEGLKYSRINHLLPKWLKTAGINKEMGFHSFRHTYICLLLDLGFDIYTVSKMAGHKDVKTTQIYAKILDEKKRTASNAIQLDFKIS
jgi:integrase